jgi:hypothetical protein
MPVLAVSQRIRLTDFEYFDIRALRAYRTVE